MDPQLARPVVVPGTADPGGPWPWGGQVAPESRPFLLASFNGGFKWGDFTGGVLAFGSAFRGLAGGQASLIVYSDGTFNVGAWGRDTIPRSRSSLFARTSSCSSTAGAHARDRELGAGADRLPASRRCDRPSASTRTARGVGRGRLLPADLATRSSPPAVCAMEMDINPDWVHFNLVRRRADGSAHGNGLFGATGATASSVPPARLRGVMVRGTVLPADRPLGPPRSKAKRRGG